MTGSSECGGTAGQLEPGSPTPRNIFFWLSAVPTAWKFQFIREDAGLGTTGRTLYWQLFAAIPNRPAWSSLSLPGPLAASVSPLPSLYNPVAL